MTEVGHEVRTLQCADDGQSPIAYRGAEHGQWEGPRRRQGPGVRPPPAADRLLAMIHGYQARYPAHAGAESPHHDTDFGYKEENVRTAR